MWNKTVGDYEGVTDSAERANLAFELGSALGTLVKLKAEYSEEEYQVKYDDLLAKVKALGIYEEADKKESLHGWLEGKN